MRDRDAIRAEIRLFEKSLPSEQRKQLGQFFTGVLLGKVLAHLSLDSTTSTVLDPFAGHGDLLDATWEAATECGIPLARLDAIEVDEETAKTCRVRLDNIQCGEPRPQQSVVQANAFNHYTIERLPEQTYDLVITNPPYVRYQTQTHIASRADNTRTNLKQIFDQCLTSVSSRVWNNLAKGYSGLADLSVPAWLLSAALVKPGGQLAMVVPATWQSRDYAAVVRYLLLRCFEVRVIVEDQQPGWFCDALVRTHLLVARRLGDDSIKTAVGSRGKLSTAPWLRIAPDAASSKSLVGKAFSEDTPEASLASWVKSGSQPQKTGIKIDVFDHNREWASIWHQSRRKAWFRTVEDDLDLKTDLKSTYRSPESILPLSIHSIISDEHRLCELHNLHQAGIRVGQGLRTGCNSFFYVTALDFKDSNVVVETSTLFGKRRFTFPNSTLQPVIRRQSEVGCLDVIQKVLGRVLDLRKWVLPEDDRLHKDELYKQGDVSDPYKTMPDQLATYVRLASVTQASTGYGDVLIPNLSAVRTNVRSSKAGRSGPKFWYMLPEFAPRHRPAAFVPRVNQETPWAEVNSKNPILVDANFSTLWCPDGSWSRYAIKALLNSSWSRAYMEEIGTPLGGGALKLEATHLRSMLVPVLSNEVRGKLHDFGQFLRRDTLEILKEIDRLVLAPILSVSETNRTYLDLTDDLRKLTLHLSSTRKRNS